MSVTACLGSVTQVFGLNLKLQSTADYSHSQHGCFCFGGLSEMSFLEIEGRRMLNFSLRHQSLRPVVTRVCGCGILVLTGAPKMLFRPANRHSMLALKTIVAQGP